MTIQVAGYQIQESPLQNIHDALHALQSEPEDIQGVVLKRTIPNEGFIPHWGDLIFDISPQCEIIISGMCYKSNYFTSSNPLNLGLKNTDARVQVVSRSPTITFKCVFLRYDDDRLKESTH